ncbi:MAG: serine/threonine protein kinase [Myxococcales bacterium]|nr:serine/threonine protein kinase [Myxococcales bacterium]
MSEPSAEPPTLTTLTPGSVVGGRYRIERPLGEGAMGAVYLAEHVHMRKQVALKVLLSEARENKEIVARFEREAIAAAHIDHPNVVSASDFGTTEDGLFFLVLELVKGESLRDVVEAGPLPLDRVVAIATQMGAALTKAHGMGIVHRDLKPENVMLVPREGEPELVKVLDFGIAKVPTRGAEGAALTAAGAIFGTPEYMSPEQALGQPVDARADLYAFGIILFELLTGKRPFDSETVMGYLAAHLNTPVPRMADVAPSVPVPPEVEAVVARMLAKVPEDRYPSVRDAVVALEQAARGATPAPSVAVVAPVSSQGFLPDDVSAKTIAPGALEAPHGGATRALDPRALLERTKSTLLALDARLPPGARALPREAKLSILVGAPLVTGILLVALVVAATRPHRGTLPLSSEELEADGGTPARANAVTPERIAQAEAEGPKALDALLQILPNDPRLLKAKIRAHRVAGNVQDALDTAGELAKADGAAFDDTTVRELLSEAFDGDPAHVAKAVSVCEGAGAGGADALLTCVTKPSKAKAKCLEALSRAPVREGASPAVRVWLDLREAQTCPAKYALLDRVKSDGDARILPQLRTLSYTSGCGFFKGSDCFRCLRRDKKLPEAIAAIDARTKGD